MQRSWDLSCLRWMGNGAEAVVGKTTRRFLQLLAPHGLGEVVSPGYGMSETGSGIVHSHNFSLQTTSDQDAFVEVGTPIPGVALRIVNEANQVVPEGTIGRLQVQGLTLMQGYYKRPDLNQQVFTTDGWFDTGDLGWLQAGRLTLTGRQKEVIIINGVNYYSHEIEAVVEELEGVAVSFTAACAVRRSEDTTDRLVIFFVPADASASVNLPATLLDLIKAIRRQIAQTIGLTPALVIPVVQTDIPKTNLGKIQRSQLVQRFISGAFDSVVQQIQGLLVSQTSRDLPQNQMEQWLAQIWQDVLQLPTVSIHDNFFELGGNSLLLMQVLQQLQTQLQTQQNRSAPLLSAVTLFQYPTIASLARYLSQPKPSKMTPRSQAVGNADIAVVGMACRFPGANSIEQFWQNLCNGVESITFLSDAEILASGIDPHLLQHPDYVKASPILECDITTFDADFFGYSPKEASLLDPQQRLLLECAWESLEDAGYNPLTYPGAIGLYAGASMNTYLLNHVYPNRHLLDKHDSLQVLTLGSMGGFQLTVANDKDYLTTRISYKLNLTGPSVNVQTACSTSLVAIHMARQSLLNGECEMALAGGVSVHTPQNVGHLYQEGMILSPDGHCRAFDAEAAGTIFGSGAGMVVLKRLDRALADGDRVYAVIKGSAIGNDGSQKVGYFAPQAEGQARVTAAALEAAGLDPVTLGYVEAHGTGTELGDPIEIAGLTQAFHAVAQSQPPTGYCAIGSVKTNVGHLNIASGVVGFIKTVLCLYHKQIPPSLHFATPNPHIDFASSPFFVNTQLTPWQTPGHPRRAGVNSLGIGGTNVHLILEEAAQKPERPEQQMDENQTHENQTHVLAISARSETALQELAKQYVAFLDQHPAVSLTNLCFTANLGRAQFNHRLGLVVTSQLELQQKLASWVTGQAPPDPDILRAEAPPVASQRRVAFLFPGQGSHYQGMGRALYQTCPVFRAVIEQCDQILQAELGQSILPIMWPEATGEPIAHLDQTLYTQSALFTIEYALAQVWLSWGVVPAAVIGHSVGEYVAACIAGVFSLEAALKLVVARGRLMQSLPAGMMAAVMADETRTKQIIAEFGNQISLAAVNGQENVVIAGLEASMQQALDKLAEHGIFVRPLRVSHAFHSPLMQPILAEFEQVAQQIQYSSPQLPVISNVTGKVATEAIATPNYWSSHICEPVRFADGMTTLYNAGYDSFIECGAKPVLIGMAKAEQANSKVLYLPSLYPNVPDHRSLLRSLAQLYVHGVTIDWPSVYAHQSCERITLPTYPFQRQRYWLDPISAAFPTAISAAFHPLLHQRIPSPLKATLFQSQFSAITPDFLADHQVNQSIVFPAAAFVEMALTAGISVLKTGSICLEQVKIQQAFLLSETELKTVQLILSQTGHFEIYSQISSADAANSETWQLHCSGQAIPRSVTQQPKRLNLATLQQSFEQQKTAHDHYHQCHAQGFNYGASFQAVQQLWYRPGEALGQIQLGTSANPDSYHLHPILLDAAFQVVAATLPTTAQTVTYLPVSFDRLHWFGLKPDARAPFWSYARLHPWQGQHPASFVADIQLLDSRGNVVAQVEKLTLHQSKPQVDPALGSKVWPDWLYQVEWRPQPKVQQGSVQDTVSKTGLWLIFADRHGVADQLAKQLRSVGQRCQLVLQADSYQQTDKAIHLNPVAPEHFQRLLADVGQPVQGVVHLWSLDGANPDGAAELLQVIRPSCQGVLLLIQAFLQETSQPPRCWFVTCGAQNVSTQTSTQTIDLQTVVNPVQTCLWGMVNGIALEHPDFLPVRVDLDPNQLHRAALDLFAELLSHEAEEQLVFRQDNRYVPRLVRHSFSPLPPLETGNEVQTQAQAESTRLEIIQRGTLDHLTWQPSQRRAPQPGQVEIRVHATGLNFRDVLNALDLYPGEAGLLGLECAGEVVAMGPGVNHLAIGDAVVAIAPGSFSQFVTVEAALVARKPNALSFEAAATIPTAFLTAYHALCELAQVKAGDRVLIHAAAGGVGQAAVQLAQQLGAEVFATAAPDKWNWLRSQGVQQVFNSRTLAFAEAVMAATQGEGVDVVLNSLAGEFIVSSLSVLRSGGRFVEIGKIDVWPPQQMADRRPDIAYFLIDLVQVTQQQPEHIQSLFNLLLPQFESGLLQPLPLTVFSADQTIDAFRFMQQAKQIGKVVITQAVVETAVSQAKIAPAEHDCPIIQPHRTYLIAGGLGDLGLKVAGWLVEQGATHLVLMGRTAPAAAQATIEKLRQAGVTVHIVPADISNSTELTNALSPYLPVHGVIHAAGVLDDGVLLRQTWERFERVMAPKVQGAWNLHHLTRNLPLDFFILFSSAASLIGSAAQANYAAANAFLDGLAHYRQQLGLPGLSINWGAWSEIGMASRQVRPGLQDKQGLGTSAVTTRGMGKIAPEVGLEVLGYLLHPSVVRKSIAQIGVLPIDWSSWHVPQSAFFAAWNIASTVNPELPAFVQQLTIADEAERRMLIADYLMAQLAKILGIDGSAIDPQQGLSDLGLDSLTAVELRNTLQTALNCRLPSTLLFDYPTVATLTEYFMYRLPQSSNSTVQVQSSAETNSVQQLSEAEAEALLLQELARLNDAERS